MHKNTKNLLDLLQDSMGVQSRHNLLPKLIEHGNRKAMASDSSLRQTDQKIINNILQIDTQSNSQSNGGVILRRGTWVSNKQQDLEIVKTKIAEIAYVMRTQKRQFDEAFLIEELTNQVIKNKSFILALKLNKQNDNNNAGNYFNSTNEILPLQSVGSMIHLLILLSERQSSDNEQGTSSKYQLSEFAQKFIKKRLLKQSQALPNSNEYVSSDTFHIDRDKSQSSFYISYDNMSFENTQLGQELEKDGISMFQQMTSGVNVFNAALKGAQNNQLVDKEKFQTLDRPDEFMGAMTRIQNTGLFGSTLNYSSVGSSYQNPFNINFEIPPLPSIADISQNMDNEEQSLVSFLRPQNEQSSGPAPVKAQSIIRDKQQQLTATNKRQLKQKQKKQSNKKSLIWSLMPYVDETLLQNNLKNECGLLRMWEDEHLDYKMRDLKVSESGLLSSIKAQCMHEAFCDTMESVIKIPNSRIFSEHEVVNKAILMLQGIPSAIFELEQATFTFTLRDNFTIQNMCLNKETLNSVFDEMMEAGSFFIHLKEFSEFMSNSIHGIGHILEQFVLAIAEFLNFYQSQVNEAHLQISQRRSTEQEIFFGNEEFNKIMNYQNNMTLLELRVHMSPLLSQIKLLATICFTQKFIKDQIITQQNEQFSARIAQAQNELKQQLQQSGGIVKKQQRLTYNAKNLKQQFQSNLDKIRNQHWLEEFPKGAQLLTYLYKILLCSESDLQAIDLLRRIFQKAIEPLLAIINMFIFTGDFHDPFREFFVEKMFKKGVSEESGSQDFVFKMTDNPMKVPEFFVEIAKLIFKTGSSVHFLRKESLKSFEDKGLEEYYQICCASSVNKFMTKMTDRQMVLQFQISKLRSEQDIRHIQHNQQSERLQEMELKIVQQEEEHYYNKVHLRDEMRREYLERKQQAEEEKRQLLRDKQLAYQKEIEEQVQEHTMKRQQIKQKQQEEVAQVRQEQEEYERKKKMIEEELKRQLLEMMKENQKLGDIMRKEGDKLEDQLLDQEVEKLIEEQKENIINNQEEAQQDLIDDLEQKLKQDEEMIIQDSNKEQQIDNVNQNNLLNAINDNDITSGQIQQQAPTDINDKNNDELQLDEIQILENNDVEQQEFELTYEQKIDLVREVFLTPLLEQVFSRLNEKKLMDRKRRTWIQKRQEERIQKAKEKRQKWKYQEPSVSVGSKINSIFQQFEQQNQDSSNNGQSDKNNPFQIQQYRPNQQLISGTNAVPVQNIGDGTTTQYVPAGLALRQSVIQVVKDQNIIVNKCLLHMMYRRLQLIKHLEVLKQFYFCHQGDVISLFMESIFNNDFESTIKENSVSFINNQFEISVKLCLPQINSISDSNTILNNEIDYMQQQFSVASLANNYMFEENTYRTTKYQNDETDNFYFTAFNMGDYMNFVYKRQYPLDMAISDHCIQKYNSIFFFLIKLKRINQILDNLWKYLTSSDFKRLPTEQYARVRRIQLLRSKMQHFVTMLEQYALTEVIEAMWSTFKDSLATITVFEDLIKLHNDFLDQIMIKCFIDKKDHKVMGQISQMFKFILQLNKIVKEYGTSICLSNKAIKEIMVIDDQFQRYTKFLYDLVKHLAYKGHFKELYLRLDFNRYYDKEQGQTNQNDDYGTQNSHNYYSSQ